MPRKKRVLPSDTGVDVPESTPFDFEKSLQYFTPETFTRFVREYPNREGLKLYIWRVWPKINRKPKYIELLQGPEEIQRFVADPTAFMLQHHGSGKYSLQLNDYNRPPAIQECAASVWTIDQPNRPPILDYHELVLDAPENRAYVRELRAEGVQLGGNPNVAEQETVKAVLDQNRELINKVTAPAAAPAGSPVDLTALIVALIQNMNQRQNPLQDMNTLLALAERMNPKPDRELAELLVSRVKAETEKPAGPLAQIKELLSVSRELGVPIGGGGSGESAWASIAKSLPGIIQHGVQLLNTIAMLKLAGANPAAAAALAQAQPAAPAPGAFDLPAAMPGADLNAAMGAIPAADTGAPALPIINGEIDMAKLNPALILRLQQMGERAIRAYQRGVAGYTFAHSMCVEPEDEQLYDSLVELGADQIMGALRMFPQVGSIIDAEGPKLRAWVDDFLTAFAEDDSAGNGEGQ